MPMKGRIQIYTGNGKGKTTAALGLSLRSVCAGGRVFFGQFLKGSPCSELSAPGFLPGFTIEQFGRGSFLSGEPCTEDVASARNGLERCRAILEEGAHDLVVLDEVNVALHYGLFGVEEVTAMLQGRADHVEVVLTGRYAPESLIAVADLVTEMREIKHYF
ncbi:MAG: cob(I)yrinic acid a,c-diamide adenosyltransferase, partial [Methanomicrobiales archaeon]|nr:cob(I)yrinic acid a,c-diamide adenosyltransferase [Methanomicrobiales archaeon]